MPSHRVHVFFDRECFGKAYWKIHRKMDEPYLIFGKRHRELFHDAVSAFAIADFCYPYDPNARAAALFHIELDELCSANSEFKMQLQILATQDAEKRRRARKKSRKTRSVPPEYKENQEFFKKVLEVLRLYQLLRS